jgi:transcriptional regulator with GAF, ATPase, and Fis domain
MEKTTRIRDAQLSNEISALLFLGKTLASVENRDMLRCFVSDALRTITDCLEVAVISCERGLKNDREDIKSAVGRKIETIIAGPILMQVIADENNIRNIQREKNATVYSLKDLVSSWTIQGADVLRSSQVMSLKMHYQQEVTGMLLLLFRDTDHINTLVLKPGILQEIADQLSPVLIRVLKNEQRRRKECETDFIIELNGKFSSAGSKEDLQQIVAAELSRYFKFQRLLLIRSDQHSALKKVYAAFDEQGRDKIAELPEKSEFTEGNQSLFNFLLKPGRPIVMNLRRLVEDFESPKYFEINLQNGAKEIVVLPYKERAKEPACLILFSDTLHKLDDSLLFVTNALCAQLAVSIGNIAENELLQLKISELSNFKQQLEVENNYLQEEINITNNFSELIGAGEEMTEVMRLISLVSGTHSSVLLMGETGTGKELIARAIHNNSCRKGKVMIKVNCATLPANLIESELFGHERGSFTGAIDRRLGKFELANNSTIFLDEIGELPLDLQSKLLRALQEQEIERIGGKGVIKTNVRVIAATNRNLEKEIELGNFRSDLFFRLNIFPIIIPPLRNRKEDIPLLAKHFLEKHSLKINKKVTSISNKVIKELIAYNWPGNVRELEHLIERTILMTSRPVITEVHLPDNHSGKSNNPLRPGAFKTIDEVEKEHILAVLRYCKGKVGGVGGAAEILKLPATTIHSKMKRLGIERKFITRIK